MTPSSPTRRSSDLQKIDKARADDQPDHQRRYQRRPRAKRLVADKVEDALEPQPFSQQIKHPNSLPLSIEACKMCDQPAQADRVGALRSEEHTSETPVTNAHLVCRLLLEKKK